MNFPNQQLNEAEFHLQVRKIQHCPSSMHRMTLLRASLLLNIIIRITGANEEDIDKAIDNKDMNKLVDYILDGEADKLRDRSSDDEEVQELINGVPKFEVNLFTDWRL